MSVISKIKLLAKLRNKEYRDAYVEEHVKTSLPFQIRALREQRDWSQSRLGEESGMRQNAISRLEDSDYGNLSVNTLLRVASAFDVGLLVKFVPFSRLVNEFKSVSPKALAAESFEAEEELAKLKNWAAETTETKATTAESGGEVVSGDSGWGRANFIDYTSLSPSFAAVPVIVSDSTIQQAPPLIN